MDTSRQLIAGKLPGALLQRLIETYVSPDGSVLIGPEVGADAAALEVDSSVIVVKSDPITFPTPAAARYLVNVNANDVVCMGGRPRWMLVTALLPVGTTTEESIETIFRQLSSACRELEISLVGGHTEITAAVNSPVLVGTLIGAAEPDALLDLRRSRPGDELLLCNTIAIEGTAILASEAPETLLDGLPVGVLDAARTLADDPGISVVPAAMALRSTGADIRGLHDPTEGGIATAIHEVARVSGCDINLSQPIPIRNDTAAICAALGLDPLGLIASGALLAVVAPQAAPDARAGLTRAGFPAARLGELVRCAAAEPAVYQADGSALPTFETDELARFFSTL